MARERIWQELTRATQRSPLKSSLTFLLLFIKIVITYTENQEITTGPGYTWEDE